MRAYAPAQAEFLRVKKNPSHPCFGKQIDWFGFDFKCFKQLNPCWHAAASFNSVLNHHVSCLFFHSSVNYPLSNEAYRMMPMSFDYNQIYNYEKAIIPGCN